MSGTIINKGIINMSQLVIQVQDMHSEISENVFHLHLMFT